VSQGNAQGQQAVPVDRPDGEPPVTGEQASGDPVTGDQATGDPPGAALLRLVAVMATLRVSCPWDARQTQESLAPHLLEECYEALDALERGDPAAVRDELGDVLLQVVFQARIASEATDGTGYTIDDVAEGIVAKLIRRHPHVFADVTVSGPEEVKQNWDAIKAAERAAAGDTAGSVLDTVPFGQPALALAAQLQRRAERAGAPAELASLAAGRPAGAAGEDAATGEDRPAGEDKTAGDDGATGEDRAGADGQAVSDLGAELFALVVRARETGLDPELELRAAARAYRDRVRAWEQAGTT
jgi:XTP/dITP diphosphohydrolase